MSDKNIMREFKEFGNKMNTLAILAIIIFITGIIGIFIRFVGFINLIFAVISFFIFLSALGNIKEAGYGLNNRDLLEFRSKIIIAMILGIPGLLFITLGIVLLILGFIIVAILFIVLAIIILLIAAIFNILAWGKLEDFFKANMNMFPANISNDARTGANLCKVGAILNITIILAFIGDILRIIGYFKLASLKNLGGAPSTPATRPAAPAPAPAPAAAGRFCPNCGSSVTLGVNYCPSCGSEI